jgi:hypothetical protein
MSIKYDPAISATKVSFNAISEFLFACLNVGEEKVINVLRSIQNRSNQSLKNFIIDVTCKEFDLSPHFLKNEKIVKRTTDQTICFSAIVFFIRKYQAITFKEIIILLNLKTISTRTLSQHLQKISKMNDKTPENRRYSGYLSNIDHKIKSYIYETSNINNNGKEKPTQRTNLGT